MLRKVLMLTVLLGLLTAILAGPALAAPKAVGRYQDRYTVFEERRPGDPNLYRYFVEDGALPGTGSGFHFQKRANGMEGVAFMAASVLFAASALAVYRRRNLLELLHH